MPQKYKPTNSQLSKPQKLKPLKFNYPYADSTS